MNKRLLRASRGALELWLEAAKWWTAAVAESAGAWREENGRLLSDTAEGLARRFQGHQIEAEWGGRPFLAVVESIELYHHGPDGARVALRDVHWDGVRIQQLSILAEEVAIMPPPNVALRLSGGVLEGRVALRELVAYVDRSVARWQLNVTDAFLIEAVSRDSAARFAFEPVLSGGELEIELRTVRWRGLWLRLPRWIRLTRKIQLPPLPSGIAVSDARRNNATVEFLLSVPSVSSSLDLRE